MSGRKNENKGNQNNSGENQDSPFPLRTITALFNALFSGKSKKGTRKLRNWKECDDIVKSLQRRYDRNKAMSAILFIHHQYQIQELRNDGLENQLRDAVYERSQRVTNFEMADKSRKKREGDKTFTFNDVVQFFSRKKRTLLLEYSHKYGLRIPNLCFHILLKGYDFKGFKGKCGLCIVLYEIDKSPSDIKQMLKVSEYNKLDYVESLHAVVELNDEVKKYIGRKKEISKRTNKVDVYNYLDEKFCWNEHHKNWLKEQNEEVVINLYEYSKDLHTTLEELKIKKFLVRVRSCKEDISSSRKYYSYLCKNRAISSFIIGATRFELEKRFIKHTTKCHQCHNDNPVLCPLFNAFKEFRYKLGDIKVGHKHTEKEEEEEEEEPKNKVDKGKEEGSYSLRSLGSTCLVFDPDRCIDCWKCLRACSHIQDITKIEKKGSKGANRFSEEKEIIFHKQFLRISDFRDYRIKKKMFEKCIACGLCSQVCPTGAIGERECYRQLTHRLHHRCVLSEKKDIKKGNIGDNTKVVKKKKKKKKKIEEEEEFVMITVEEKDDPQKKKEDQKKKKKEPKKKEEENNKIQEEVLIIEEKENLKKKEVQKDQKKKEEIFVALLAPSSRYVFFEEFGFPEPEESLIGYELERREQMLITLLRNIAINLTNSVTCSKIDGRKEVKNSGMDYVFDLTFGADMCKFEEAIEILHRISKGKGKNKEPLLFTSCCPAFVNLIMKYFNDLKKYLSECKSPMGMMGVFIKKIWGKVLHPNKKIVLVAIMPCVGKKAEEDNVDYVLTVREFAKMVRSQRIDVRSIQIPRSSVPEERLLLGFDNPLFNPFKISDEPMRGIFSSNASLKFGEAGGVLKSVLRLLLKKKDFGLLVASQKVKNEKDSEKDDGRKMEINVKGFSFNQMKKYFRDYVDKEIKKKKIEEKKIELKGVALNTGKSIINYLKEVSERIEEEPEEVEGENDNDNDDDDGKKSSDASSEEEEKEEVYDDQYLVIEGMACPGGCIGGGGTPKMEEEDMLPSRKHLIEAGVENRKVTYKYPFNLTNIIADRFDFSVDEISEMLKTKLEDRVKREEHEMVMLEKHKKMMDMGQEELF